MINRNDYGKLVDGQLQYPPAEFHENGMSIVGFTEDFILQHGYKNIVQSDPPAEEGYTPTYTLTDNKIVQGWEKAE